MKLYACGAVCDAAAGRASRRNAYLGATGAGYEPEVVSHRLARPFNCTPRRGAEGERSPPAANRWVPALLLDDGTVIDGSGAIADWGPRQPRVALARGGRGRGLALLAVAAVFELGVPPRGGPAEGQRQERAQADRGKRQQDSDGCRGNHRADSPSAVHSHSWTFAHSADVVHRRVRITPRSQYFVLHHGIPPAARTRQRPANRLGVRVKKRQRERDKRSWTYCAGSIRLDVRRTCSSTRSTSAGAPAS